MADPTRRLRRKKPNAAAALMSQNTAAKARGEDPNRVLGVAPDGRRVTLAQARRSAAEAAGTPHAYARLPGGREMFATAEELEERAGPDVPLRPESVAGYVRQREEIQARRAGQAAPTAPGPATAQELVTAKNMLAAYPAGSPQHAQAIEAMARTGRFDSLPEIQQYRLAQTLGLPGAETDEQRWARMYRHQYQVKSELARQGGAASAAWVKTLDVFEYTRHFTSEAATPYLVQIERIQREYAKNPRQDPKAVAGRIWKLWDAAATTQRQTEAAEAKVAETGRKEALAAQEKEVAEQKATEAAEQKKVETEVLRLRKRLETFEDRIALYQAADPKKRKEDEPLFKSLIKRRDEIKKQMEELEAEQAAEAPEAPAETVTPEMLPTGAAQPPIVAPGAAERPVEAVRGVSGQPPATIAQFQAEIDKTKSLEVLRQIPEGPEGDQIMAILLAYARQKGIPIK